MLGKELSIATGLLLLLSAPLSQAAGPEGSFDKPLFSRVQLGPRPHFLVEKMSDSPLKEELEACTSRPFFLKTDFSIGHRGACMQFPEHTRESYVAAAQMGAGIVECDVTFTQDKELVCRHSQCDLHTTTDIVTIPELNAKCTQPFEAATFDSEGNLVTNASAKCCTSDITLAEFKTLTGKMDGANYAATTPEEFLAGTANWRTDLYSGPTSGTLMTHAESIELFKSLGVKMTPELKAPSVEMPFDGYTQEDYAQQMIDEYIAARVSPRHVYPQSFNIEDVRYWIAATPWYARQAVYLDDANEPGDLPSAGELADYKAEGINYVAPPMWALLDLDVDGNIVPSQYAIDAKAAGLKIITWTLERSGILADGDGGWYYQTINGAFDNEGVTMEALDVLAQDVGIEGIFSDWPATVTFYANCVGLLR